MNIKLKLNNFAGGFILFIVELQFFFGFISGQGAYEVYGLNSGNNYDTSYLGDQYPVGYDLGRSVDTMAPPANIPSWLTVPQSLAGYPIYLPQQVIYASFGSSNPVQSWGDYKWNNFYIPTIVTEPKNDSLYDNFEDYVAGRWTPPPPTVLTVATTVATLTRAAAVTAPVATAVLPTDTVAAAAANHSASNETTPLSAAASDLGLSSLLQTNATVKVSEPTKAISAASILVSAINKLLIRPATIAPNTTATVPGSEATTVTAEITTSSNPFPPVDEISAAAAQQVSAGEFITASSNADIVEDETEAPGTAPLPPTEAPPRATALQSPIGITAAHVPVAAASATEKPAAASALPPAGKNLTEEVNSQVQTAVQSAVASALPQTITNPLISPSGSPFLIQTPPPLISAAGVGNQLATETPGKALLAAHPEAANVIKAIIDKANATAQQLIAANETAANRTAREHPDDLRSLVLDLLDTIFHSADVPPVNSLRRSSGKSSPLPLSKTFNGTFERRSSTTTDHRKINQTVPSSSTTKMLKTTTATSTTTVRPTINQTAIVISRTEVPSLPVNGTGQSGDRESRAFKTNLRSLMTSLLEQLLQADSKSFVADTNIDRGNGRMRTTLSIAAPETAFTRSHVDAEQEPSSVATRASTTINIHLVKSASTTTNSVPATILPTVSASSFSIEQPTPTESSARTTTASTALSQSALAAPQKMVLPPLRSQLNFFGISKGFTRQMREFRHSSHPSGVTIRSQSITRPSRKRGTIPTAILENSTSPTTLLTDIPATRFVKKAAALDKEDLWKLLGISIDPVPLPNIDHSALRASEIRKTPTSFTGIANKNATERITQASDILDFTLPTNTPKHGICAPYEDQGTFGICVDKTEVFSTCDGMVIKKAKFCESSAVCCVSSL